MDSGFCAGLHSRMAVFVTTRQENAMMESGRNIYERPIAEFDDEGNLLIRASQATDCRGKPYYAMTEEPATDEVGLLL